MKNESKLTDCQFVNGTNYCEKKKRHIAIPQDCYGCKDNTKPSVNENLQVLVD